MKRYNSMKITLGAARKNAGLTQPEAAKLLGVGISVLRGWEQGRRFPKPPQIDKICSLYGMTYEEIRF